MHAEANIARKVLPFDAHTHQSLRLFFSIPLVVQHDAALISLKLGRLVPRVHQALFANIHERLQVFDLDATEVRVVQQNWYMNFAWSLPEAVNLL